MVTYYLPHTVVASARFLEDTGTYTDTRAGAGFQPWKSPLNIP